MPTFVEGLKKKYRYNKLLHGAFPPLEKPANSLYFPNPSLLSKTSAYEVVWNSPLPVPLQNTLAQNPRSRLHVDYQHQTISLLTETMLSIYQLSSETEKRTLQIQIHDMNFFDQLPLFDICTTSLSALIVSLNGQLRYVKYGAEQIDDEISLTIGDNISSVQLIHDNQALLGTLSGEIYLFQLDNQQRRLFSFYQYQTWFDAFILTGSYYRTLIPSLSSQTKSNSSLAGKVIYSKTFDSVHYVGYSKGIQVWEAKKDNSRVELFAECDMHSVMIEEISQHIPSGYQKDVILCEIVDINIQQKSDIVLLISYTLPDMHGYHQFLVLHCQLELNDEKGGLGIHVIYSASISYTTLKKREASLKSTRDMAFVSFRDAVIAISINKKSIFEEAVYVYDRILSTELISDTAEHYPTALIYTRNSGVIQFTVDVPIIQQSWLTNNMYSRTVRDIQESDTHVFKSRLEQAVFFGDLPKSPLRFILRQHNQEDVSLAALMLSSQLLAGDCWLLPSTTKDVPYPSAQNYFQKRILSVLEQNDLLDKISGQCRQTLAQHSQQTTLNCSIASYITERREDTDFMNYITHSIQPLLPSEADQFNDPVALLLRTKSKESIRILKAVYLTAQSNSTTFKQLCQSIEMIKNVLTAIRLFENQYVLAYNIRWCTSFTAIIVKYLFDLWCRMFNHPKNLDAQDSTDVTDTASLILDCLLDTSIHHAASLEDIKAVIFNTLFTAYENNMAVIGPFTQKHNCIPLAIDYVESTEQKRERHVVFVEYLGYDYLCSLLVYLSRKENTFHEIEFYCLHYPQFVSRLIDHFEVPKIAWVHYVRQGQYKKSYEQLLLYLDTSMSEEERKDAIAWQQLIKACIQEADT